MLILLETMAEERRTATAPELLELPNVGTAKQFDLEEGEQA